jgi:hypothetical protein
MNNPDSENVQFRLAHEYVTYSDKIIFLTGKAGTGKTTFLKHIRETSFKRLAVVAPTGVAAINAGGVTIHSLFQIPPGLFLPEPVYGWNNSETAIQTTESLIRNMRLSPQKRQLIEELQLLVIDEVSMVRADMIDAIDTVLRHIRRKNRVPFGGVQLLLIGDLFQLSPVVKPDEWELMRSIYRSTFFFDARVFKETSLVYLELQKIYRQKDEEFINILNAVRNNEVEPSMIDKLHEKYDPQFTPPPEEFYITLTTHNNRADLINHQKLASIPGSVQFFEAEITGDFPEKNFPAEYRISLKPNAQIMFIKNDKGEQRRFFNGKIATVSRIDDDQNIFVTFDDVPEEMQLEKETWRNIRYQYDREKDRIVEEEVGSFKQYPIRLAWAITIHKSQGLTFEKAIIDAGSSFSAGQVYVALSRMTGLDGIILKSRIHAHVIKTDEHVIEFCRNQADTDKLSFDIEHEKDRFIENTLLNAFNFEPLIGMLRPQGYGLFTEYASEDPDTDQWFLDLQGAVRIRQDVSMKFQHQLLALINDTRDDRWTILLERTKSALLYFQPFLEEWKASVNAEILQFKSRIQTKKHLERLKDIHAWIIRKQGFINHCLQVAEAMVQGIPTSSVLMIAEKAHLPMVVENKVAVLDPEFKTSKLKRGATAKGEKKDSSTSITLKYFRDGLSPVEIARERGLANATIMGHLLSFIPSGEVQAEELVAFEKLEKIRAVIKNPEIGGLKNAKDLLGDDFSFDEIRAVLLQEKRGDNVATPPSDLINDSSKPGTF